ncbi:hypothetical protein NIES970_08960 [[Synechococcus] sp. NIES-970]|uniref:hypothetical protein n=1 Tax=Picosynechococcus sp. NKBG15041c TaxID=1407650 RepID=UPI0003F55936|nr:hypothetical protein [Picosynechococcus sp. NKBG15041c]BAW95977.1 hypothetical protein NIES970_08960 [[Synechococcus] sp. NIES-970]
MLNVTLKKAIACGLISSVLLFPMVPAAIAATPEQCALREESFGFTIDDYGIEHQNTAILNIAVDFRYVDQPTARRENYLNFVPMAAEIDRFLREYPNETDYWEIMNRNLAESLFAQNPQMESLRVRLAVAKGSGDEPFNRHSVVSLTRDNGCPLTHS